MTNLETALSATVSSLIEETREEVKAAKTMPVLRTRCCDECGAKYGAKRDTSRFCATACRTTFHKRRAERGAELYDLMMAQNFERKEARAEEVWTTLGRLVSAYRDADKSKRDGRKSWRPLGEALADIPLGYGTDGDKR